MPVTGAEPLRALYALELRIRDLETRTLEARRLLQGDPAAPDPRPRLLQAQSRQRELATRLEQAEARERSQRARARSHEQRLYSGAIHNARELSDLSQELDHLKSRLAIEETEELELLQAVEDAAREVEAALAQAAAAKDALDAAEHALTETRRALEVARGQIADEPLRLYDRVRIFRPPPPVAEVVGGLCSGCRIAVSLTQMRALRFGTDPQVCQTCGRILVLGEA